MKTIVECCVVAAVLGWCGLVSAQSDDEFIGTSEDEYLDTFGEDAEPETVNEGPSSISDAIRTRRGYRIGASGVHRRTVPEVHTVREGETLWDITNRYYGDPWQWPKLWSYNPEITNPHWIYPLDRIRLAQAMEMRETEPVAVTVPQTFGPVSLPAPEMRVERAPVESFEKESVFLRDQGYLDEEALRTIGEVIGGFEEQMFLSNADTVYLKFEPEQDVRIGQQYTFFREMHDWERDPEEEGRLVRIFGTAVIQSYDRERRVARGVITETLDPIERGFQVAYMERRFDLVAPVPNEKEVVAEIVASIHPRSLLAYGNIVFLDVGQDSGVKPGNRFFVMRRGDNWRESIWTDAVSMGGIVPAPTYDRDDYPDEAVAELRVIKVRKETTIALVTRSDTDVLLGDRAEMRKGF